MTAPLNSAVRVLRPSLVIAEALVDRQGPTQIQDRARKLGFSPLLTNTVVGACCGQEHCDQAPHPISQPTPIKTIQS